MIVKGAIEAFRMCGLPDPDPKKCICKGSGIIVHGDGHKTVCPYHGKKTNSMQKILSERDLIFVPLLQVE